MPEVQFLGHTIKSHGSKLLRVHMHDWLILLVLTTIDAGLNAIEPFHRYVSSDMMSYLKYPLKIPDTVPMWAVPIFAVLLPCVIFLLYYFYKRDVYDLHYAVLGLLYSVLVTAVVTDSIKDAVGRPRPNFFYRCFPDGVGVYDPLNGDVMCTGDMKLVKEGYKSFPSGHSSWSFAGLGFLSWYLCGKIKVFDGRGHAAKLCIVLLPYLFATLCCNFSCGRLLASFYGCNCWIRNRYIGIFVLLSAVLPISTGHQWCVNDFTIPPRASMDSLKISWATHESIRILEENGFHSSYNRGQLGSSSRNASPDLLDDVEIGRRY